MNIPKNKLLEIGVNEADIAHLRTDSNGIINMALTGVILPPSTMFCDVIAQALGAPLYSEQGRVSDEVMAWVNEHAVAEFEQAPAAPVESVEEHMHVPEIDSESNIVRDEEGRVIYAYIPVSEVTDLQRQKIQELIDNGEL